MSYIESNMISLFFFVATLCLVFLFWRFFAPLILVCAIAFGVLIVVWLGLSWNKLTGHIEPVANYSQEISPAPTPELDTIEARKAHGRAVLEAYAHPPRTLSAEEWRKANGL